MGLLHEIFTTKQTLHTFEHGNTKTFDASAVKLNIIQNSIYGVDIEKGAVDIARLRFWLSLIVDEEKPKALPNLDYKIVVGNSLVSKLGDDIIDIDWTLNETSHGLFGADLAKQKGDLLKKISKEQKEFFNPNSDKKKLAADIRKLKIDLLITQLELMVKTQGIETKPTGTNRNLAKQTEIYLQTIGWKNTIKDLQKLKTKTEVPLQFFDWKLDFPEVLKSVITDKYGFDIVIGKPPYGGKFTEADKQFFKGRFKNKDSETESYILFLELGGRLQSINGALWYIIPSNISTNPSYNNICKHTLDNFSLQMIIDLGSNIFESASVDSCIFAFKNQKLESVKLSCGKISSRDLADSELKLFEQKYFLTTPQNIFNFYINTETSDLIGKIQSSASNKLSDFIDFSRGIEFGYSSDYVYDTKGRNRKPLIAGRCFNRYELRFDNKFVEVDFSDTSNFKTKAIYENPKIFVRRIGKEIIAYLDTENYYNVCDVYNLLPNSKKTDLNEILGLINSKCINYFFSNFFKNAKELFPKIPIKYLKEVPISLSNGKISKLTKSVQKRRIEGKDTKSLE
ncbi:MAG: Eco57I restriction-modification methylase domain-containing protein [Chlorobi bacterium]|nr:Eco57I restriction-modification methylase domain-containing protein [Chlorobiota bacterium]